MLISINSKRGQANMGEYGLVIFMVLATIVAMTVYFKRAVQARIYDARNYMMNEVDSRTAGSYDGPILGIYEPYYVDTTADVTRTMDNTSTLLPGASSGVFIKAYDESTDVDVDSSTLEPAQYNLTTPPGG